ncbi:MAG: heparinase II/III family protein [Candidatus Latescibacteria bacterium]|nr:heparinase II/III family protein [Candidatus Latescibacterota bacterium]
MIFCRRLFICAFIFSMFFITIVSTAADITSQDVSKALRKKLEHPYLYFTGDEKSAILDRINNNSDCDDIMQRLLAGANRWLFTPVEATPPARVREARYNASYDYERFLYDYCGAAYDLAFVYQMTGDERYAIKAFEFIDIVCDQPTWVHGAHEFPEIYDRVWPWGAKDDQVVFSYAQATDHIVFKVAAIYDWLYTALDKCERDRIRGALLEKAILRVRGNYEYHWWAAAYRCNWCSVCNSSLGIAAMALLTEDPQLTDVIAESWNRIGRNLDEIKDGGWQEGMGYLNYTVTTSLEFADVFRRVTEGEYNLFEHPRFGDAVKTFLYCQFPGDKSVHFGDSGGGRIGSYNMYNRLMLETGNKQAAWLRAHLTDEKSSGISDLFMPKSHLEPSLPNQASIHFPAVNWLIMRSDFTDPENVVIAAKSALHDDPHHGHLDSGHFCLYWRGQEFLCDHGSAGYDRKYFDEERWDYPLASSAGHNTVLVNGERQIPGKLKNKPWDLTIGGKVLEFKTGDNRDYALMDQTKAYPGKELKGWRRHIVLDKPQITLIVDEIECTKGSEIETRFHSTAEYTIEDNYVLLTGDKGTMALVPVETGKFTIRPGKHAIMMAQKNAQFRWAPYFGTVLNARENRTVMATVILPVADKDKAKSIAGSVKRETDRDGNVTISLVKDGKTYSYGFKKGVDGLVVE